jgi:protein-S-isoprenylcysteine O-methyltransferase Ste14
MSRTLMLLFAIVCYAIFFATFLYLIAFVGDFGLAARTVDKGPIAQPLVAALIDVVLIALFGLQHSVMARPAFKAKWTRLIPHAAERSVYVLAASVMLMILFLGWRPIGTTIWDAANPTLQMLLWALFCIGWGMVLVSTFLINHFELFGLQQAWFNLSGREAAQPELKQPLFYRWVAHPMMLGFFFAFWAIPTMTAGHLLLAAGMSAYILIALRYEERDLTSLFGDDYRRYRAGVGLLLPKFGSGTRERPAA